MEVIKLSSGLLAHRLNEKEQQKIWNEVTQDINPIGKNIELFTPQDNKSYFILSEIELKYDSYVSVIKANNKTFKVKYNICNQDVKINNAVRKAYQEDNQK